MSGFASAIYEGRVRHRRHAPRAHAFEYRMAQLYLDLDEVDAVFRERWLWSVERPNRSTTQLRTEPIASARMLCSSSSTNFRLLSTILPRIACWKT